MAYDDRKYVIIPAAEVAGINFSEVMETAAETCRYSVDGAWTFVKYDGSMPPSVASCAGRSGEYSHDEMLGLLDGPAWTRSMPEEV